MTIGKSCSTRWGTHSSSLCLKIVPVAFGGGRHLLPRVPSFTCDFQVRSCPHGCLLRWSRSILWGVHPFNHTFMNPRLLNEASAFDQRLSILALCYTVWVLLSLVFPRLAYFSVVFSFITDHSSSGVLFNSLLKYPIKVKRWKSYDEFVEVCYL